MDIVSIATELIHYLDFASHNLHKCVFAITIRSALRSRNGLNRGDKGLVVVFKSIGEIRPEKVYSAPLDKDRQAFETRLSQAMMWIR